LCNPLQAAKAPEKVLTIEDFPERIRGDLIYVQKVMEKLHEVLAERTMHLQHMYDILRDFIFGGNSILNGRTNTFITMPLSHSSSRI
jgi:hypothetical protein